MSSRRHATPGTLEALREDLAFAASRRLPHMFKDVATDKRTYATLARVLRHVEPVLWAEDPTRALRVVMLRAVDALPKETAEKCKEGSTWRHLGRLLYLGSEVDSSLRSYDDCVIAAKEYSGVPWARRSFTRDITGPIRQKLAAALLNIEQSALDAREKAQTTAVMQTSALPTFVSSSRRAAPFIPRPSLDEQFNHLWNTAPTGSDWARPNVLCLIGEIGTGKSRYVRELLAPSKAVWINAESVDALSRSLGEALKAPPRATRAVPRRAQART